jgi:DNA-binding MarR family transcriptional regulator
MGPRWLTETEQQSWLSLIGLLFRLDRALDSQLRRDADITHFEYMVMSALSESPDRTRRMSLLAAMCEGSLSRLSQVVSRLEKRGWVSRTADPIDGRYTLATLTEAGWDKVVATAPGHVAEVRRVVFDPLTQAQVRQVAAIAGRIMRVIGEP